MTRVREMLTHARLSLPMIEIEKKIGGEYDQSYTPPPEATPTDTDQILLLRTGGITGKPKYASFNHKQIAHACAAVRGAYHFSPADRFMTSLSWAHPFAFIHGLMVPLMLGGTSVVDHGGMENKDISTSWRIARHPPRRSTALLLQTAGLLAETRSGRSPA